MFSTDSRSADSHVRANRTRLSGATVYPLPASPMARLTVSLLDRQFNQPRHVEVGGRFPQGATRLTHPAMALVPQSEVDPNVSRLQAGLAPYEDELYYLIMGLARPLGVVPDSNVATERGVLLSARNLALLYRHARLARLLKISIRDLLGCGRADSGARFRRLARRPRCDDSRPQVAHQQPLDDSRARRSRAAGVAGGAVSRAPMASTAAGVAVTYTTSSYGAPFEEETVTFAENSNLAMAIADWNTKALGTIAYRADLRGVPQRDRRPAGHPDAHNRPPSRSRSGRCRPVRRGLAQSGSGGGILAHGASSRGGKRSRSRTRPCCRDDADRLAGLLNAVFTRVPTVTEEQSRALIEANGARLEAVDNEGRFRLRPRGTIPSSAACSWRDGMPRSNGRCVRF